MACKHWFCIRNPFKQSVVSLAVPPGPAQNSNEANDGHAISNLPSVSPPLIVPTQAEATVDFKAKFEAPDQEASRKATDVEHAEKRLDAAAKKLKKKLPPELLGGKEFNTLQASADINSVAQQIAGVVGRMMAAQDAKTPSSPAVKTITAWVKKVLPFIKKGLHVAKVRFRFVADHLIVIRMLSPLPIT
jgi:hypothetical protein